MTHEQLIIDAIKSGKIPVSEFDASTIDEAIENIEFTSDEAIKITLMDYGIVDDTRKNIHDLETRRRREMAKDLGLI